MWTLLAVLFWLIVALVLVAVVVFFSPVHLRLWIDSHAAEFRFELRLFSARLPRLVRIRSDLARPKEQATAQPETHLPAKPSEGRNRRKRARRSFQLRNLLHEIPALIGDTLAAFHIDRLMLHATFGTGDPAITGELYGFLCPLSYGVPTERVQIAVTPDFAHRHFDGTGEVAFHFTPARLAWPTLRTGWRLFVWPR